jgi:LDH2 family malate/lactate/ureidoglycolate dehydrogenase
MQATEETQKEEVGKKGGKDQQSISDYCRIEAEELRSFVSRCMRAVGAPDDHAATVADILVEADLRGIHSHGVNRLDMYVIESKINEVDAKAVPSIIKQSGATALVDGCNALGMVAGKFCMELAIKKAKEQGIGWVCCKRSNHYGIAGYYAMMAQRQGLVGISYTNSSPLIFPTRAKQAALGTNPIAVAAPSNNAADPFVLDMATSTVSLGKVEYYETQGKQVPIGWGTDSEGRATTNPKEIMNDGGLSPIGGEEETGGYKGYGLAMMVEVFCGILGGADYGTNIPIWRTGERNANIGHCFVAIDPSFFDDGFTNRMSDLMEMMRGLPPTDPSKPVLCPGDPERIVEAEYRTQGIKLHSSVIASLNTLAEQLNVQPVQLRTN